MTEAEKLLKARQLKSILNQIADASLEYKEINEVLPFGKARYEGRLDELIKMYEKILIKLIKFLKGTEYFKSLTNSEYEIQTNKNQNLA